MTKRIKLLTAFIAILAFYACSSTDADSDAYANVDYSDAIGSDVSASDFIPAQLRINQDVFNELNSDRKNEQPNGDPYTINYVKRVGDFIQVNVSYSGGCKEHSFELIWDGVVYTDPPCFMNLILLHDGNDDNCEAYITNTITINLDALVGDVSYKDSCDYNIFSTYNSSDSADAIVQGAN